MPGGVIAAARTCQCALTQTVTHFLCTCPSSLFPVAHLGAALLVFWASILNWQGNFFKQNYRQSFCDSDITPRGCYPILKCKLYSLEIWMPQYVNSRGNPSTAEAILLLLIYSVPQDWTANWWPSLGARTPTTNPSLLRSTCDVLGRPGWILQCVGTFFGSLDE